MKLNDFVEEVYFINLKRREDRLEHSLKEFNKIGVEATRIEGIDAKEKNLKSEKLIQGAIGAIRSHKKVIRRAIKQNQSIIAVFEDDVVFCDDFESRFSYYAENIPPDWEIMYLGCHFHGCKDPIRVKKNIHKIIECFGCFAMILNNKNGLFKDILDLTKKEEKPIDDYFHDVFLKNNVGYVHVPFFVRTLKTVSDIGDVKEAFSYDVVDIFFVNEVGNREYSFTGLMNFNPTSAPPPPHPPSPPQHTYRNICEEYFRGRKHFKIYYNNRLLFDSSVSDRNNLSFFDNHFVLYGRNFSYNGMYITGAGSYIP